MCRVVTCVTALLHIHPSSTMGSALIRLYRRQDSLYAGQALQSRASCHNHTMSTVRALSPAYLRDSRGSMHPASSLQAGPGFRDEGVTQPMVVSRCAQDLCSRPMPSYNRAIIGR